MGIIDWPITKKNINQAFNSPKKDIYLFIYLL